MNPNKIIGYLLLTIGVVIVVITLWQTYNILFTKTAPTQIFNNTQLPKKEANAGAYDIQAQVQNALIDVLPLEAINNLLNLFAWLVLTWIFILGGAKLSDICIKLLKNPN